MELYTLIRDICHAQQRKPCINTHPEDDVSQQLVALDHRYPTDSYEGNLDELEK